MTRVGPGFTRQRPISQLKRNTQIYYIGAIHKSIAIVTAKRRAPPNFILQVAHIP
jgi:hypothetical protein